MREAPQPYCDVALPVPLDQIFTYEIPPEMRDAVRRGCRVLAPFGARNLVGIILQVHDRPPQQKARPISKLLDDDPVLDEMLLKLGKWIADYYSAPLGEVFRGMLPLGGEFRRKKTYTLTEAGHDAARQLLATEDSDPATAILRALAEHARTEQYLSGKTVNARTALRALIKRGWV
ncbi:MAG TPA: primosomal protein N', partial [Bryobacteraceae bacterium]